MSDSDFWTSVQRYHGMMMMPDKDRTGAIYEVQEPMVTARAFDELRIYCAKLETELEIIKRIRSTPHSNG